MTFNLFIIGPSGCGKSTQAKLIAEKFNVPHFSVGQMFKDEVAIKSGYGIEVKKYLDEESQVPDDLIFDIILSKLKPINFQNFVISGFPSTLNQARVIEFYFRKNNLPSFKVISLNTDQSDNVKEFFTKKKLLVSNVNDIK